jgi:hypothetical protein
MRLEAMQAINHPGLRYLARCALIFAATVSLWYFALLGPLLGVMRVSTETLLAFAPGSFSFTGVTTDARGDWEAAISVPGTEAPPWLSQYIPAGKPIPHDLTIRLTAQKTTLGYYTLGLPMYWAFVLAAPLSRRLWRALAFGTMMLAAGALVLCLVAIGHLAAPYLWGQGSAIAFALDVGSYLGAYVVPYIAPFLIALWLLPDVRAVILPWEPEPEAEPSVSGAPKARANRPPSRKR